MSIETDLGRIATALEEIAIQGRASISLTGTASTQEPVKVSTSKKTGKIDVVKSVEDDVDPFSQDEKPKEDVLTLDKLKELLTIHAKKLGTKTTIALIIKHGADPATPKINTIPETNFQKCFDEATLDLKKVEKNK